MAEEKKNLFCGLPGWTTRFGDPEPDGRDLQ